MLNHLHAIVPRGRTKRENTSIDPLTPLCSPPAGKRRDKERNGGEFLDESVLAATTVPGYRRNGRSAESSRIYAVSQKLARPSASAFRGGTQRKNKLLFRFGDEGGGGGVGGGRTEGGAREAEREEELGMAGWQSRSGYLHIRTEHASLNVGWMLLLLPPGHGDSRGESGKEETK